MPDRFGANQVGILVSNFCTLIAGYMGVKTVQLKYPKESGYFMAFLIFFAPHTIYFSMTYTEAMFLMFTIAAANTFWLRPSLHFLPLLPELQAFFWCFLYCCFYMKQIMDGTGASATYKHLSNRFFCSRFACLKF